MDPSLNTLLAGNPLGSSITLDEIEENFALFEDWEDRYGYIIDIGKQAPLIPEALRTEERKIHGCQSQVWFVLAPIPDSDKFYVLIDSDAMIVRGLAAVVMSAFNQHGAREIAETDMNAVFTRLDLIRHLSPTRGNGLRAMVKRIQSELRPLA